MPCNGCHTPDREPKIHVECNKKIDFLTNLLCEIYKKGKLTESGREWYKGHAVKDQLEAEVEAARQEYLTKIKALNDFKDETQD